MDNSLNYRCLFGKHSLLFSGLSRSSDYFDSEAAFGIHDLKIISDLLRLYYNALRKREKYNWGLKGWCFETSSIAIMYHSYFTEPVLVTEDSMSSCIRLTYKQRNDGRQKKVLRVLRDCNNCCNHGWYDEMGFSSKDEYCYNCRP